MSMVDPADELRRQAWDRGIRPGVHTPLCEQETGWKADEPFCSSCGARLRKKWPLECLRDWLVALGLYPSGSHWWRWGGL